MKLNKLLLLCLIFPLLLTACSDDDTSVTLFSKTWKPSLHDKNVRTNPPPAIYSSQVVAYKPWFACELDDTYKFNKNGTLVITHNAEKCDGEVNATTVLTYTLDLETKDLVIDGIKYTLCEVSPFQLKYSATISHVSGYGAYVLVFK